MSQWAPQDAAAWVGRTAHLRLGIVVSRFNASVTERLLEGALAALAISGVPTGNIATFRTPGAFEIPALAKRLGRTGRFDALIALGAIIQGETPHFQFLCAEVSRGIGQAALDTGVPIAFGVLTATTSAQAEARSTPENNKGAEAALAAVEMALLFQTL